MRYSEEDGGLWKADGAGDMARSSEMWRDRSISGEIWRDLARSRGDLAHLANHRVDDEMMLLDAGEGGDGEADGALRGGEGLGRRGKVREGVRWCKHAREVREGVGR